MLSLLTLLSCADYSVVEIKQPEIIVAPETLDFGHLLSGFESRSKEITIANGGTEDLVIDHLEIFGNNFSTEVDGFTVPSGGWHQVDVSYTPLTYELNEGYIDIYLKGQEEPSQAVWLIGNGDAPLITLNPLNVDFGTPLLGCEPSQEFIIQNDGNINLEINSISFMSTIPQELNLNYGSLGGFPWTIIPTGRIAFWIDYLPEDEVSDQLNFQIDSNDPLAPLTTSFGIGSAVFSNETIQHWIQESNSVVDILWIIDNSGSMMGFQTLLGLNMQNFMNMFLSFSPDYQIAFITTDDPTFINGIISSNSGDPASLASSIISSIGTRGSATETGIAQLMTCFSMGDCISFTRPDSKIVVIFMSDEPDHSVQSPTTVKNYFDANWPNEFVPYAIVGDPNVGCASTMASAMAGHGYLELINLYSSTWWSICDDDWGSQMEEVALALSVKSFFEFTEEDPVIDSIKVWINGQLTTEGWSYDEDYNGVRFNPENAPSPGDSIDVSYSTWGCAVE